MDLAERVVTGHSNVFFVIDEGKNDISSFVSITRVNVIIFILLERVQYYMSIFKEAHSKMRKNGESDESFKKRFTTE